MPRTYARLSVAIWTDDDYRALPMAAQWLYVHILAHPKLSLCGVLDMRPKRWARLADDMTEDAAGDALAALEDAGYLLVDWEEEEVLVRTFTAHDLSPGRMNRNLAAGFWAAYGAILSPDLRAAVVRGIPGPLWEKLEPHGPGSAVCFRRSPRLEPEPPVRFEPEGGSTVRTPTTVTTTHNQHPHPWSQSDSRPPVDNPPVGVSDDTRAKSAPSWDALGQGPRRAS